MVILAVVAVGAATSVAMALRLRHEPFNGPDWPAEKVRLTQTVIEKGSLESEDNGDIACEVKAKTAGNSTSSTIRWVLDDGTLVKAFNKDWENPINYESEEERVRWSAKKITCPADVPVPDDYKKHPQKRDLEWARHGIIMILDDATLQDQKDSQEIVVLRADFDKINAEQKQELDKNDYEKKIKDAETSVIVAQKNLLQYIGKTWYDSFYEQNEAIGPVVGAFAMPDAASSFRLLPVLIPPSTKSEGLYKQQLEDVLGRIKLAISDRDAWQDRAAWSLRMYRLGYVSKTQADSDQSKLDSAQYALDKVITEEKVLEVTKDVEETTRRSTLIANILTLKNTLGSYKAQKKANDKNIETTVAVFKKETDKKADLIDQIAKCVVKAPRDGMLVYYFSPQAQGGFGSRQPAIAQGEPVSEGQKMLRIPNMEKMLVRAKIHEAMFRNVKPDQRATVLIDSVPGRSFKGHVKSVSAVPSVVDMFSSDVKLFEAVVAIDPSENLKDENLKPQMTARVIITSDTYHDKEVLCIPIQSTIGNGPNRKCFVIGPGQQPKMVDIEVLMEGQKAVSNDRLVGIKSGIAEGDRVVLNPAPLLVGEKSKLKAGVSRNPIQGEGKGPEIKGVPAAPAGGGQKTKRN